MKITVVLGTILLVSVLAGGFFMSPASAQEGAQELSTCTPDADDYEDCLTDHSDEQDVLNWIHQEPANLTENQQNAVYALDVENSTLADAQKRKVNSWRLWQSDARNRPDWAASSEEETTEPPARIERRMTADVYVSDYDFNAVQQTVNVTIHNGADEEKTIYIIDTWSNFEADRVQFEEVTVGAGETVSVEADAMNVEQSQYVSVQIAGNLQSAVNLQSGNQLPWDDEQSEWEYVWVFGLSILISGILAVIFVAIYVWIKSGRKRFNTYDKVHERL